MSDRHDLWCDVDAEYKGLFWQSRDGLDALVI